MCRLGGITLIIGLDVGGTNIDAVAIKDRKIISKEKMAYDKTNLLDSIVNVIDNLLTRKDRSSIKRINLSTTVSTNAVVKKELSTVGMLIQSGPGLNIESEVFGDETKFIKGSTDHRGRVVEELDLAEIVKYIKEFNDKDIETCGVVTKFSTRNSTHEKIIEKLTENHFAFTTVGHGISGKLNFPRRINTTYLNSAVHNTFSEFSRDIKASLKLQNIEAPIYILKADGGTMTMDLADIKPVETILSGPAASFMGVNALLPKDKDGIFIDIGGTTTDIFFLVDGVPVFEPQGIKIDKYKTLVRSIYSVSIPLGGDSVIDIKDGKLRIESKKGYMPTPTDAMIFLDLIEGGNKRKAEFMMNRLSEELNISPEETANLVLSTMGDTIKQKTDSALIKLNNKTVYTVKEVLFGRKIDPKFINIVGGPAKSLAPIIEEKFNLCCEYPKNYDVANAIGAALAKPTMNITLNADTERKVLSISELGIYETIRGIYNLDIAKEQAIKLLKENMKDIYDEVEMNDEDFEIIESSSFNMVDGFFKTGENIRVTAQVKPGIIYRLRGEDADV